MSYETQQQVLNSMPPVLRDMKEREIIHKTWNAWFDQAEEHEIEQYGALRWKYAPNQPCSVTRLVRACQQNLQLAKQLPQSLLTSLQEAELLPA